MSPKPIRRAGAWNIAYAVACGVLLTVAVGQALLTGAMALDLTSASFRDTGEAATAMGFALLPLVGAGLWLAVRGRIRGLAGRRISDLLLLALVLVVAMLGLNSLPVTVG